MKSIPKTSLLLVLAENKMRKPWPSLSLNENFFIIVVDVELVVLYGELVVVSDEMGAKICNVVNGF